VNPAWSGGMCGEEHARHGRMLGEAERPTDSCLAVLPSSPKTHLRSRDSCVVPVVRSSTIVLPSHAESDARCRVSRVAGCPMYS